MWNILNFEISRMRERHPKRNRTIFGDYWLCKIPYKGISTLYLLYDMPGDFFIFSYGHVDKFSANAIHGILIFP